MCRSRASQGAPIVVAGLAGAGKTELLEELDRAGEQVLDLEALACHRGSAFGSVGMPPQPSHAEFARLVRQRLASADPDRPLWIEDEGRFIGSVGVPEELQAAIAAAPVVQLRAPFAARVERLAATYANAEPGDLLAALERSAPRLGEDRATRAAERVAAGDLRGAVAAVLPYFDATYRHRMSRLPRPVLHVADSAL